MDNLIEFFKKLKSKKWARSLLIVLIIFIIVSLIDEFNILRKITRKITPKSMEISMIKNSEIVVIGQVKKSGITTMGSTKWAFRSFTLEAEEYLKGVGPDEILIPLASSNSPSAPKVGTQLIAFLNQDKQRGNLDLYQPYGCPSGFIILNNEEPQETIKYVKRVMQGKTILSFIENYIGLPIFYVCI